GDFHGVGLFFGCWVSYMPFLGEKPVMPVIVVCRCEFIRTGSADYAACANEFAPTFKYGRQ
ncbi:MAG: hypothetical protein RQ936_12655, partial [Gammaproteobacteria bacterium]|nr:hypothetical protein [Gammaproteobacteria bacterium]